MDKFQPKPFSNFKLEKKEVWCQWKVQRNSFPSDSRGVWIGLISGLNSLFAPWPMQHNPHMANTPRLISSLSAGCAATSYRKKRIFISYSCNGPIAASEEGEGQSHGMLSSKPPRIFPSQGITVCFAEPDSFLPWQLMCLDICLGCGSMSSPVLAEVGTSAESISPAPLWPWATSFFVTPTQEVQQQKLKLSHRCRSPNPLPGRLTVFPQGIELPESDVEEPSPQRFPFQLMM